MSNGLESGLNWALMGLLFLLALMGGGLYAWGVIRWARRHGFIGRYTTFLIVGGCILTVALCVPVIGFLNAAFVGVMFVATGAPQVAEELLAAAAAEKSERQGYTVVRISNDITPGAPQ